MASNIVKKGYDLTVLDIRTEPMKDLEAKGAKIATNPKELSSQVDVVITMLLGPPEIREVILGEDGVIKGLKSGSVVIDMSTSSPTLTREIAWRLEKIGCKMLDSPVTGGIPAAEKGTLALMVGGDSTVLKECRDILESMATDIIYIGTNGMGHIMKLVNQLIFHTGIISICEAFALGVKAGIDPNNF
jgi:2-hydroxy-3-oxopropionate reductase